MVLNLAAITSGTTVLGPGNRAALWVQGCKKRCPGCLAKEWLEITPAQIISIPLLAQKILQGKDIQGLTISGGEPMLQASALHSLVVMLREQQALDVICYSGYTLDELVSKPPSPGVPEFLKMIDVLIDGAYVEELNNNQGLRGSTNQQVHHFTDRLKRYDFQTTPRSADISISDGEVFLIGVPTKEINQAFEKSIQQFLK